MKKLFSIIIFLLCFSLNAQTSNSNYFTIGSTKNKVLQIQGEPTSVSKTGLYSSFSYGSSSISFTNGLVDGYYNAGNLKVKMTNGIKKNSNTVLIKKKTNNAAKTKFNNQVRYIYFTFLETTSNASEVDFFGNIVPRENEYSKMYSISGYTYELEQNLEFCLTKEYKETKGRSAILIPNSFDNRQLMLQKWNDEKGRLFNLPMCYYLTQYGVMEE
jgi:hypothetical protein